MSEIVIRNLAGEERTVTRAEYGAEWRDAGWSVVGAVPTHPAGGDRPAAKSGSATVRPVKRAAKKARKS